MAEKIPFDYIGAKKAGYSDEEIQGFLKQNYQFDFDLPAAKKSGYTDKELADYISAYDVKKKGGGDVGGQPLPSSATPIPSNGNPPSLSAGDIGKIKDYVTGTTQEQRNAEKLAQAKVALPKQKPLVAAQPVKKISPKQIATHADETFKDPLFQIWLQRADDPVGELRKQAEAAKAAPVDINNYDASLLHNENQHALDNHVADVVTNGLFEGGHDAAAYLKKRGVGEGVPRELNATEQVAVQKVKEAEHANSLLDHYSLEEAALRNGNPELEGKTLEQYKRENNAQAGQAYAQFIQDPNVQERAKHDPKLRLQLLRAENTLTDHFPDFSSAQIASKISQKLEDSGKMSNLSNNPTKEQADWAVTELEKEGKLSLSEKKLYEKSLVPQIEKATTWHNELARGIPIAGVFAAQNPIKSRGVFENALESFRNTLKGGAKTAEEATVAPAMGLFSQHGLQDYHNQGVNEGLKQTYFEPTGFGKYTTTFGNIAGMVVPTILGASGLQAAGASSTVANGLAFALSTAGQHQADARELFKGKPLYQPVYTALMSTLDYALGGGLSKAVAKGVGGTIKQEVADAIKGYTTGELSGAAAKDMVKHSLLKNGFDFAKETAVHNLKGAGMMAAPAVVDAALQNAFGDHPPEFKKAVEEAIGHAQVGFWASTPLSAFAAMGSRANKMNARMLYEQASHPDFRGEMERNGATPEQLKNYDVAQKILKELRRSNVETKDLPQLLLHELNQKILSEKASETESPSLKAQIREQINASKEKSATILNRQTTELRPQDYGVVAKKQAAKPPETPAEKEGFEQNFMEEEPSPEQKAAIDKEMQAIEGVTEKPLPNEQQPERPVESNQRPQHGTIGETKGGVLPAMGVREQGNKGETGESEAEPVAAKGDELPPVVQPNKEQTPERSVATTSNSSTEPLLQKEEKKGSNTLINGKDIHADIRVSKKERPFDASNSPYLQEGGKISEYGDAKKMPRIEKIQWALQERDVIQQKLKVLRATDVKSEFAVRWAKRNAQTQKSAEVKSLLVNREALDEYIKKQLPSSYDSSIGDFAKYTDAQIAKLIDSGIIPENAKAKLLDEYNAAIKPKVAENNNGEKPNTERSQNPAVHETRTAPKNEQVNPAETKPTTAPKPKSEKKETFHQEVDKKADALISFLTPKTAKGASKAGIGIEEIVRAGAEVIKATYDLSLDAKDAIEKGIAKMKGLWDEKEHGEFPEEAIRAHYESAYAEAEPPKGEPPLEGQSAAGDGGENWTAIRKEKLKEIAKVKEHFEKETGTTWSKIQQAGLEKAAEAYPEKDLPDAIRAYTMRYAAMYDAKEDFNPTSKDLAVFQEFKRQTEVKKRAAGKRLDSDNYIERMAAVQEVDGYDNDLVATAKALNPREAGTAFGYRASESRLHPDFGLETRKMQLIKSKGGAPLTDSERTWLKKQWEEEKALMDERAKVREQGMQEEFDRKLEEARRQYEALLQKNRKGAPAGKQARIVRNQSLSQKGKEVADKIRRLKTPKGGTLIDFSFGTWNLAVEVIAQSVEKGSTVIEAIDHMVKEGKIGFKTDKDRQAFEDELSGNLDRQSLRDSALEKLKEFDGEDDVTNEMVAKGIVRDYVNSFLGEVEQKDLLETATKELQEHLPSLTKKRLIEAYLKEGEFRQPTKKELEGSLAQQKKELVSIAKLTEDLEDLENLKAIRQRSFPTERERSAYEKELFDKKEAQLVALQKERAKVAKTERDAQRRKDKLGELDANIRRAKEGLELINTYRKKSESKIDDEISKKKQELAKVTKENMGDERAQKIKLQNTKEARKQQIKELKRKLAAGEYEETEPTILRKKDAALIRLDRQKAELESVYRKKQQELKDKNRHWYERGIDFIRAVYVNGLIAGTGTYGKIAAMSIMRPLSEAGTKLTMGKVFDAVFPNISRAAEKGGEGSSVRSMQLAFGAYFKQMGPEKMNRIYEESNTAFENANEKWKEAKDAGEPSETLKQLKEIRDEKLLKATGNVVYQFIGGSSIKDAMWNALFHRANEIERQFGHMDTENFKDGDWLDKTKYVLGFIGRSHSALKTFSGRFSFAAGFMARLEAAVRDGQELTSDKMLEIGHESYLDWERGKYQQDNLITHMWNGMVNKIEATAASKNPAWAGFGRIMQEIIRGNMPITRVPVNIIHEMVLEYTLGAIRVLEPFGLLWNKASLPKAVRDARRQVEAEGLMADSPEFKERLKAVIQNLDPQQAATIARCFRKGTIGLGFYALLGLTGIVHFGGFPHLGQRKQKDEDQQGEDELNAGQVQIGDKKLNHFFSGIAEHIPMFYPMLMGTGMAYEYKYQVGKGKTTWKSASKAFLTQLQTMENSVPQAKVLGGPVSIGVKFTQMTKKRAEGLGMIDEEEKTHPKPAKSPLSSKPHR